MSMHKKPLTELERSGLEAHGLAIGTPSQLSDSFRLGVAWAESNAEYLVLFSDGYANWWYEYSSEEDMREDIEGLDDVLKVLRVTELSKENV